jgi:protein-L-isoaspartate(D-aspartate) O-methyltransferase
MNRLVIYIIIILTLISSASTNENSSNEDSFTSNRNKMVEIQIKARGITDANLIEAMLKVKRHLFVPDRYKHQAYFDHSLPISNNQTISQPFIVAIMTELAHIGSTEKVLEVGTGSGYQAAILAELADSVFSVEIICELAEQSEKLLNELGYKNIFIKCDDGFIGWEKHAPYDAIIVTCAPPDIPHNLIEQLAEGGRMVIPVGTYLQELMLITKNEGEIVKEEIIPVRFVPMTGEAEKMKKKGNDYE